MGKYWERCKSIARQTNKKITVKFRDPDSHCRAMNEALRVIEIAPSNARSNGLAKQQATLKAQFDTWLDAESIILFGVPC